MKAYFVFLTGVFAFVAGHALARLDATGDWFYRYAFPMFTVAAVLIGLAAVYLPPLSYW